MAILSLFEMVTIFKQLTANANYHLNSGEDLCYWCYHLNEQVIPSFLDGYFTFKHQTLVHLPYKRISQLFIPLQTDSEKGAIQKWHSRLLQNWQCCLSSLCLIWAVVFFAGSVRAALRRSELPSAASSCRCAGVQV